MKISLLSAAVLGAPLAAVAAPTSTQTLDQVVITGQSGSAVMPDPVIQTYVIDREQIERHPGASALDLLRLAPGIDINQSGPIGSIAGVFVRGNRSQATLVLIDGMRYAGVGSGSAQLAQLPIDAFERVEIYYGPAAAARFGADGSGAVIQFFTKKAKASGAHADISVSRSTDDILATGATLSARGNQGGVSLTAGFTETPGYDSTTEELAFGSNEPDADGFRSEYVALNSDYDLGKGARLNLSAFAANSVTDFDQFNTFDPDFGNSYSDQQNQAANLIFTQSAGDLLLSVSHGFNLDNSDSKSPYGGRFDSRQDLSKIYLHKDTGSGLLSFGAERLVQRLDAQTSGGGVIDETRTLHSAVIGATHEAAKWDLSATARVDDYSRGASAGADNSGSDATEPGGSLGAAYAITPELKLGAQVARSFRLPSFNELYFPGFGSNPDLKPERSRTYEVFSEFTSAAYPLSTRLSVYRNDVSDFIVNDETFTPQNIAEAKLQGVSIVSGAKLADVDLSFSYDYLDAEDKDTGDELPYRAAHKASLIAGTGTQTPLGAGYAQLEAKWTDSRASVGASPDLESFWLLGASYRQPLSSWAGLTLRGDNLLDSDYELVTNYNSPGISATLALDMHF